MLPLLLVLVPLCSAAIYEKVADLPTLDFDYIIVGGGTAGNVLANRLTEESNTSVLVLEAGNSCVPFFCTLATPNTPLDWNFTTVPQPGLNGRAIPLPRGFGLGGSSAVNYMTYTRGSSEDYDRYARTSGDDGWGWDKIQPYFRKNERFVTPADHHNTTGEFDPKVHGFHGINSVTLPGYPRAIDNHVLQTTKELPDTFPFNLDFNSGYQLGIGWEQTTVGNGTRSSSQTSYLGPGYIDRKNLHVLVHSYVTRILVANTSDSHLPRFNTVEFTQDAGGKDAFSLRSQKIILSAGSIGTPHILLNSGVGDADELSALGITPTVNLPDVGRNLTDHPRWSLVWSINDTSTIEMYWRNDTFQADALAEWEANRTGYIASTVLNHIGFSRIGEGLLGEEPCAGNLTAHYELIFASGIFESTIPATGNYFTTTIVLLCPLSRGSVTINSTNPLNPPLINPNFFSHLQDIIAMQYAVEGAQRFTSAPVWKDYIIALTTNITDLEDSIRNEAGSTDHQVSTASMSPFDADWGAVDPDLRLKKAMGVRVVDASVLPFIPAAHAQAAVYVIAERAADLIKGWK
ncbi:aryl-alcohol-oxidase from pleurotus Eryingii [Desarmillaria tabescens]|uniref:Aryl-alcohol-oxidase from pleurotus Eryingii n=1 Tax=Armillaria tabescens TaxID=1929756 RepID=A0AA39KDG9_ARMTA|nr:aryl-alcohol-oxidase from pleurotus Eryingii [Desarmillaria tabescens]KAK0459149.1 aryl-alcohol-oxidase from pleurotus Eryingii [Desarmillaria tabescens]